MTEAPYAPLPALPTPTAQSGNGWVGAVRTGSIIVLCGLVGGLALGALWAWITPSLWLVIRDNGAYPEPSAQERWFSADGWFLILGLVFGVILAVGAWWRGRRHPVGALLGIALGGLLGAVTAWWVGGLLGPADPAALFATAKSGTRFEQALGLRAMAVLLAPAIAGVGTFVALAAAAAPQQPGERIGE